MDTREYGYPISKDISVDISKDKSDWISRDILTRYCFISQIDIPGFLYKGIKQNSGYHRMTQDNPWGELQDDQVQLELKLVFIVSICDFLGCFVRTW